MTNKIRNRITMVVESIGNKLPQTIAVLVLISLVFTTVGFSLYKISPNKIVNLGEDTGNLPSLKSDIFIDCKNPHIKVIVMDENKKPIQNADVYLFYTNYGYNAIATGKTSNSGIYESDFVGNLDYLTALFILKIKKPGYNDQDNEFYYRCPKNYQSDEENIKESDNENEDLKENNSLNEQNNETNITNSSEQKEKGIKKNETGERNNMEKNNGENKGDNELCPIAIIILGSIGLVQILFRN